MIRADGDKINGSDVVVVENWATWSGPCREISPDFAQVEEKHPHLKFVKVDVDSQQTLPTFIAYKDGNAIRFIIGANPQELNVGVVFNG
nr:hypothetical protein L203_05699 [Cryptococcus depauperatus CBS 7841]